MDKDAIFSAKEKSGVCMRMCCPAHSRGFEMKVNKVNSKDDSSDTFLHIDRPFVCTLCCCNRPEMKISLVESNQNKEIGKTVNPWMWCNLGMHIFDN